MIAFTLGFIVAGCAVVVTLVEQRFGWMALWIVLMLLFAGGAVMATGWYNAEKLDACIDRGGHHLVEVGRGQACVTEDGRLK